MREDSEDLFVQQRHLLEPRQLLSELHLQAVASAVFPFEMLDGADAPEGGDTEQREISGCFTVKEKMFLYH